MKKLLVLVTVVALTSCAGVRASTDKITAPTWDGRVGDMSACTSEQWLGFNVLPSLFGGFGFNLNGDGVAVKVLPINLGADFTSSDK